MNNVIRAFSYDFIEGDKGMVFSTTKTDAYNIVVKTYGEEYSENHKLEINTANFMGNGIFCIEDTWK